jgi:hypothetical protein
VVTVGDPKEENINIKMIMIVEVATDITHVVMKRITVDVEVTVTDVFINSIRVKRKNLKMFRILVKRKNFTG